MRRFAVLLIAGIALAGCSSFRPRPSTAPPEPATLRIELRSGERVELVGAIVSADSVVGMRSGRRSGQGERTAIALSEVAAIEQKRFAIVKTFGLAILIGLVVWSVVAFDPHYD
jgi:hypothetical protein